MLLTSSFQIHPDQLGHVSGAADRIWYPEWDYGGRLPHCYIAPILRRQVETCPRSPQIQNELGFKWQGNPEGRAEPGERGRDGRLPPVQMNTLSGSNHNVRPDTRVPVVPISLVPTEALVL